MVNRHHIMRIIHCLYVRTSDVFRKESGRFGTLLTSLCIALRRSRDRTAPARCRGNLRENCRERTKPAGFARSNFVESAALTDRGGCAKVYPSSEYAFSKGNEEKSRHGDTAQRARNAGNGYGRPRRTWSWSRMAERFPFRS